MTGTLLIVGASLLIVLIVPPLRALAGWLLTKAGPGLVEAFKIVLHAIVSAHVNVIRNLQPRQKLIYELNKGRTSHTQEK